MKFFVVDDTKSDRDYLVELLRDRFPDADIVQAVSGIEARDKLFECPEELLPNFFFTDFEMRDLNGLELIGFIRNSSLKMVKELKIALLTGFVSSKVRDEAIKLDCWFLQKPFKPEELYQLIDKALNRR